MSRVMSRTGFTIVAAALVVMPGVLAAQAPTAPPASAAPASTRPIDRNELRRHIYVMEGALQRAVSFGAQRLNREIRNVAPEMVALSGDPQARGLYLDGYGVFFNVGVPILHQSMVWSLRTMIGQDPKAVADALAVLKQLTKDFDPQRRSAAENAIMRLQLEVGPIADPSQDGPFDPPRSASPAVGASIKNELPPETTPPFNLDKRAMQDPNAINRAYTELVQRELIDAMIDYSLPMTIPAEEYLTVAARDNMQRDSLAPPDPQEEIVTILLRIKGADLAAYRAGQIDRDQVRKRVQVQEF
jgi:hypothetical protein